MYAIRPDLIIPDRQHDDREDVAAGSIGGSSPQVEGCLAYADRCETGDMEFVIQQRRSRLNRQGRGIDLNDHLHRAYLAMLITINRRRAQERA